jgi:lipopolysaccharide export system permease protein
MLFHSSLRRELSRSFGATLVVLATIVLTMLLIRSLGLASRGSVDPQDVMLVIGYSVLGQLPTILALSLFIAIVSCLSRMYRDSEMVIWFASGRGLMTFLAPVFRFAWPILLAISLLSLVVWPWSNQQVQNLRDRYERRGDLDRVVPGQFQESAGGTRVFFVDKESVEGQLGKNVFISSTENNKEAVTSARSARVEVIGDDRFLLLSNGQRLETVPGQKDLRVSEFAEYGTNMSSNNPDDLDARPVRFKSSLTLFLEPTRVHLGELAWRIGLALAAINFVVIAVAVSSVNPRSGRSANFAFALFAFIFYYNLLNLGQTWIGSGQISFTRFMLTVHLGALLLGLLWLYKRHINWTLRSALNATISPSARAARSGVEQKST